jgi:hypothetical protein
MSGVGDGGAASSGGGPETPEQREDRRIHEAKEALVQETVNALARMGIDLAESAVERFHAHQDRQSARYRDGHVDRISPLLTALKTLDVSGLPRSNTLRRAAVRYRAYCRVAVDTHGTGKQSARLFKAFCISQNFPYVLQHYETAAEERDGNDAWLRSAVALRFLRQVLAFLDCNEDTA